MMMMIWECGGGTSYRTLHPSPPSDNPGNLEHCGVCQLPKNQPPPGRHPVSPTLYASGKLHVLFLLILLERPLRWTKKIGNFLQAD